jgi:hypothetical protein
MTPDDFADVRRLLDAVPVPPVEPIDVAAIYREASAAHARSARRWKWAASAAVVVAAALLFAAVLPRLEVKVTGREFVLRWGMPDPPPAPPAPAPVVVPAADSAVLAKLDELDARFARSADRDKKLKDLEDLLLTLAFDVDDRDGKRKAELANLARDLRELRADTRLYQQQAEKTSAALYTAIFDKPRTKE